MKKKNFEREKERENNLLYMRKYVERERERVVNL